MQVAVSIANIRRRVTAAIGFKQGRVYLGDRIWHSAPAKPEAFPPDDATLSPLSFY